MPSKCKCQAFIKFKSDGTTDISLGIQFCPLHAAAEEMRRCLTGWIHAYTPETQAICHEATRLVLTRIEDESK